VRGKKEGDEKEKKRSEREIELAQTNERENTSRVIRRGLAERGEKIG